MVHLFLSPPKWDQWVTQKKKKALDMRREKYASIPIAHTSSFAYEWESKWNQQGEVFTSVCSSLQAIYDDMYNLHSYAFFLLFLDRISSFPPQPFNVSQRNINILHIIFQREQQMYRDKNALSFCVFISL